MSSKAKPSLIMITVVTGVQESTIHRHNNVEQKCYRCKTKDAKLYVLLQEILSNIRRPHLTYVIICAQSGVLVYAIVAVLVYWVPILLRKIPKWWNVNATSSAMLSGIWGFTLQPIYPHLFTQAPAKNLPEAVLCRYPIANKAFKPHFLLETETNTTTASS